MPARKIATVAGWAVMVCSTGYAETTAGLVSDGPTSPALYRLRISGVFPEPGFPQDNQLSEEGVALGRRLFFDKQLSRDGTISCASCHDPAHAFSDPRPFSAGVNGAVGRRHSQPLFNLAWRRGLFWDGRVNMIREQVFHPLEDPTEMASRREDVLTTLAANQTYVRDFAAAFPGQGITTETLGKAIEQFLLVQVSQDSKFDKAHRGELQLTEQEQRGFQLFFAEFNPALGQKGGDCFHCHGNATFSNERFANNGLSTSSLDLGRFEATGKQWDKWVFKVPSLRNVALTAPYMHDGRFKTLEEVVDHYDHGVVESPTLDPNLAKHQGAMGLPPEDKAAIVAFLRTLTDEEFVARAKALAAAAERAKTTGGADRGTTAGITASPAVRK